MKSSGKINVFLLIYTFMCGQTDFDDVRREKQGKVMPNSGGFDVEKRQCSYTYLHIKLRSHKNLYSTRQEQNLLDFE